MERLHVDPNTDFPLNRNLGYDFCQGCGMIKFDVEDFRRYIGYCTSCVRKKYRSKEKAKRRRGPRFKFRIDGKR